MEQFVFNTWQEALISAERPTAYEQKYNIHIKESKILLDNIHLKIAMLEKSDKSITMVFLIKKAKDKELWINWIPTDYQFNCLMSLPAAAREYFIFASAKRCLSATTAN